MRRLGLGAGDLSSLASEVLLQGGWMTFTVTGTSMLPTLRTGDLVRVEPCGAVPVEPGEIVLYRTAVGGAALHRVASVDRDCLTVRGDARPGETVRLAGSDVLGRMVSAERNGAPVRTRIGAGGEGFLRARHSFRRARAAVRKAAGLLLRLVTSPRPVRRLLGGAVSRRVRYEMLADVPAAGEGAGSCAWMTFRALLGSRVVGTAQLVSYAEGTPFSGGMWLFGLAVSPLCRGCGIGRTLARRVIRECSSAGATDLRLLVEGDNASAIALYRSLGFREMEPCAAREALAERVGPGKLVMVLRTADASGHLAGGDLPL